MLEAEIDSKDNYTSAAPWRNGKGDVPDYLAALDKNALQGARLGVPWELIHIEEYYNENPTNTALIHETFNHTLSLFRKAGATVVDNVLIPSLQGPEGSKQIVRWIEGNASIYASADYPTD
jgi:amidase